MSTAVSSPAVNGPRRASRSGEAGDVAGGSANQGSRGSAAPPRRTSSSVLWSNVYYVLITLKLVYAVFLAAIFIVTIALVAIDVHEETKRKKITSHVQVGQQAAITLAQVSAIYGASNSASQLTDSTPTYEEAVAVLRRIVRQHGFSQYQRPAATIDSMLESNKILEALLALHELLAAAAANALKETEKLSTGRPTMLVYSWLVTLTELISEGLLQFSEGEMTSQRVLRGVGTSVACSPLVAAFLHNVEPVMASALTCDNATLNAAFAAAPVTTSFLEKNYFLLIDTEFQNLQETIAATLQGIDPVVPDTTFITHIVVQSVILVVCLGAIVILVYLAMVQHEMLKEQSVIEADFDLSASTVRIKRRTLQMVDFFCSRLSIMCDPNRSEKITSTPSSLTTSFATQSDGADRTTAFGDWDDNSRSATESTSDGAAPERTSNQVAIDPEAANANAPAVPARSPAWSGLQQKPIIRTQVELYIQRAAKPIRMLRPFVPMYMLRPNTELKGEPGKCPAVVTNPELIVLEEGLKMNASTYLFVDLTAFNVGPLFEASIQCLQRRDRGKIGVGAAVGSAPAGRGAEEREAAPNEAAPGDDEEEMRLLGSGPGSRSCCLCLGCGGGRDDAASVVEIGDGVAPAPASTPLEHAAALATNKESEAGMTEEQERVLRGGMTEGTMMINELLGAVTVASKYFDGTPVQVCSDGILIVFHADRNGDGATPPRSDMSEDRALHTAFAIQAMCETRMQSEDGFLRAPIPCKMTIVNDNALEGITSFHVSKSFVVLSNAIQAIKDISEVHQELDATVLVTSHVNDIVRHGSVTRPVRYIQGIGSIYSVLYELYTHDRRPPLNGAVGRSDGGGGSTMLMASFEAMASSPFLSRKIGVEGSDMAAASLSGNAESERWERAWAAYEAVASVSYPPYEQLEECLNYLQEYQVLYESPEQPDPVFRRVLQHVRRMIQRAGGNPSCDASSSFA